MTAYQTIANSKKNALIKHFNNHYRLAAAKLGEPGPPGPPLGFFFLTAESGNPPAGLNMASHVELSRSSDSRSNNFGKLELRFG